MLIFSLNDKRKNDKRYKYVQIIKLIKKLLVTHIKEGERLKEKLKRCPATSKSI